MHASNNKFLTLISSLLLIIVGMYAQQRFVVVGNYLPSPSADTQVENDASFDQLVNFAQPEEKKQVNFQPFWEVWALLERDYLDKEKIDAETMVDGAIAGLTASLDDPYTMYLSPKDNERSEQELAGAFFGVGIELGYIDGILAAVTPLKGSPAEAAGVLPSDLIIKVTDPKKNLDEETTGWTLPEAVEKIRGEKGDPVTLTIIREGETEPLEISVIRDEIVVESVVSEIVEYNGKKVAHITLSRFGQRTDSEWEGVVKSILSQKNEIDGIVLDMRNNPGGYFDGAITIASDFIKEGVIVTQKGKVTKQDFEARGTARLADIPTVVLVNKGSASASEIVAGAIRDQNHSPLVGENTFGKGTVQDRRELSNGGGIHITVSRWLLPGGSWIHHEGIPVDHEVEQDYDTEEDEQLHGAIEQL